MKNKKTLSAILAAITALTCSSNIVSAEETTEASTEAVTEVTSEITTEMPAETTAATEETTVAIKTTILRELNSIDAWTDGNFSKTIELGTFGYDFGAFANLMLNDSVIDRSNYTVSQNGNESITFTINAAFMSTLSSDTNYFTADFEKITLEPAFAVVKTRFKVLFEPEITPDRWTDGEYKRIIDLQPYIIAPHSYGKFLGLYMGGNLVDSEYYTVVYDKDKSIAFTFNKKFREKYGNTTCNFNVEFENMSLKNLFRFTITDPAEKTQTESPKTGDNNASILTAILGLSGITACVSKKRKSSC